MLPDTPEQPPELAIAALVFAEMVTTGTPPTGPTLTEGFDSLVDDLAGRAAHRPSDVITAQAYVRSLQQQEPTEGRTVAAMVLEQVWQQVARWAELDAEIDRSIEGWTQ